MVHWQQPTYTSFVILVSLLYEPPAHLPEPQYSPTAMMQHATPTNASQRSDHRRENRTVDFLQCIKEVLIQQTHNQFVKSVRKACKSGGSKRHKLKDIRTALDRYDTMLQKDQFDTFVKATEASAAAMAHYKAVINRAIPTPSPEFVETAYAGTPATNSNLSANSVGGSTPAPSSTLPTKPSVVRQVPYTGITEVPDSDTDENLSDSEDEAETVDEGETYGEMRVGEGEEGGFPSYTRG